MEDRVAEAGQPDISEASSSPNAWPMQILRDRVSADAEHSGPRHTHDDKRHGTTSLFAALDVKAGTIIGKCMPRHGAAEFRSFLDMVEKNVRAGLNVHVMLDNASSHKTKLSRDWFVKRPRRHPHFTPTSASWVNQVEHFSVCSQTTRSARHTPTHPRTRSSDCLVYPNLQRRFETVPLDEFGR